MDGFRQIYYDVSHRKWTGQPVSVDRWAVTSVRDITEKDHRDSVHFISEMHGLSQTSVHKIVTEALWMYKVSA